MTAVYEGWVKCCNTCQLAANNIYHPDARQSALCIAPFLALPCHAACTVFRVYKFRLAADTRRGPRADANMTAGLLETTTTCLISVCPPECVCVCTWGTILCCLCAVFPGLGWLLTRAVGLELMPTWPPGYWDDNHMRKPAVRRGRQCIFPEVPRTHTFGAFGASNGMFFFEHLDNMVINTQHMDWREKVSLARAGAAAVVVSASFPRLYAAMPAGIWGTR